MSGLISSNEAKLAWANGEQLQVAHITENEWRELNDNYALAVFTSDKYVFRLKPRTITINGIELPAPDYADKDPNLNGGWAINIGSIYYMYRSERNYKLVVEALHQVFGESP